MVDTKKDIQEIVWEGMDRIDLAQYGGQVVGNSLTRRLHIDFTQAGTEVMRQSLWSGCIFIR